MEGITPPPPPGKSVHLLQFLLDYNRSFLRTVLRGQNRVPKCRRGLGMSSLLPSEGGRLKDVGDILEGVATRLDKKVPNRH